MKTSPPPAESGLFAKALAFIAKDFREEISYRMHVFFTLFGIVFAVLVFFFLSRVIPDKASPVLQRYGGSYFSFALIGFALTSYLNVAILGMGHKIREAQLMGTLEALLMTRTPAWQVLFLSVLYPLIFRAGVVVFYLFLGAVFFGLDLSGAAWGSALFFFVLTVFSLGALGVLSASAILAVKKGDPVAFAMTSFSYLVSGVFYPVEVLPGWLQGVAQAFPLTHALEGLRMALLKGVSFWELPKATGVLLLFCIFGLPVSLWIFAKALKYARKSGGLHHY